MATIALDFKTNAKDTNSQMKSLSGSIKNVGLTAFKAFGVAATAATALGGAIASITINAANNRKELTGMARLAGVNVRQFKSLTFATEQYGISAEQFSDISKDVTEKLGEFAAAGSGAFVDFMDVMKISKEEAQGLAKQLSNMSAPEAIKEIARMMQGEGIDQAQMSFVFESLGSDLTKLMPLLADNSKEWDRLTGKFDKATSKFRMTDEMSKNLIDLSASFSLLSSVASTVVDFFSAHFAPVMTTVTDGLIKNFGDQGLKTVINQVMGAIADFGVVAITALKPVVYIVQKLLDGLNKVGTWITYTIAGFSGLTGSLLSDPTNLKGAMDIGTDLANKALDRGVQREESIQGLGSSAQAGLGNLEQVLMSLRDTIEKSNANNSKQSIVVKKGLDKTRTNP